MKRKIYLRTFGWLMGIWLIVILAFTLFILSIEKDRLKDECLYYANNLSVMVERFFEEYEASEHKGKSQQNLYWNLNSVTAPGGYEVAIYTTDLELIMSTNDYWYCQYTAYEEVNANGSTYYSGYAYLDPKKWFKDEEIAEMEEYLYNEYQPKEVGDISGYSLNLQGFWLDGEEIIPKAVSVIEFRATTFDEKGRVTSSSGNPLATKVYKANYPEDKGLPYYSIGHINGNRLTYPNGKLGLRSDARQVSLREAVLDKEALKRATDNFFNSPVTEERKGLTYRFYIPYPYQSTVSQGKDGGYTSEYWIVIANEFNLLNKVWPTLVIVWISSSFIFALTAGILSTQTYKTFQEREKLEEQRKELTKAIAHDLKTPLAVISGYAENLLENIQPEKREHYARGIKDNVERCDRILRDMLEIYRMESGYVALNPEKIALAEITEEILTQYADILVAKEITLHIQGSAEITGDKKLIKRALDNLISNAVVYTDSGGKVQIDITKEKFSIFNSGFPIPSEELYNIWHAYYKLDKARIKNGSGSGLGLSIVRSIFELHGFQYGVENLDKGVCFWFRWSS